MKLVRAAALLLCLSLSAAAAAQTTNEPTDVGAQPRQFSVSAGVTAISQYRFRGISLSDEDPAVQATVSLAHDSGLYAGLWASTIDGFGELGGANVELDLYGGYRLGVGSGATLDVGLLYYAYPGSKGGDFDFFEPYASVAGTLGPVTAKIGAAYAPAQDALADNSNLYLFGDVAAGIPATGFTIKGHLGRSKGDTRLSPSGRYFDWLAGVDYVTGPLILGAAYVDTDLDAAEAASAGATRDIVDSAIVLSLTASF